MSNEHVAPETKGVAVELLATVDLGPEIEGMEGRQLRMRMVTIEMGTSQTTGRVPAGPRTGTPSTGSRTGGRLRRWRSRSMSSSTNRRAAAEPAADNRLCRGRAPTDGWSCGPPEVAARAAQQLWLEPRDDN